MIEPEKLYISADGQRRYVMSVVQEVWFYRVPGVMTMMEMKSPAAEFERWLASDQSSPEEAASKTALRDTKRYR